MIWHARKYRKDRAVLINIYFITSHCFPQNDKGINSKSFLNDDAQVF